MAESSCSKDKVDEKNDVMCKMVGWGRTDVQPMYPSLSLHIFSCQTYSPQVQTDLTPHVCTTPIDQPGDPINPYTYSTTVIHPSENGFSFWEIFSLVPLTNSTTFRKFHMEQYLSSLTPYLCTCETTSNRSMLREIVTSLCLDHLQTKH